MHNEGKARVLDEPEFKRLLLVAKNGQFAARNVAMLYCSFGLGLRAKEIASLNIGDVADSNLKLFDEVCLRRATTKGEKQRHVYLVNPKVYRCIYFHLQSIDRPLPENPLFQTQRKSRFTANSMQKWFARLFKQAGIDGASSHSGRRTYITRLIENGVDIKAVSHLAGHASIMTTSGYVQDNPERLKRIAAQDIF